MSSYYYSLVLHHWLIKLSKITNFRVDFSFVAKSAAKVLLFFGLTKFLSNFFQYFLLFFVSGWFSALHFLAVSQSVVAHLRSLRNRLQRYCFFLDWPNILRSFLHIFCIFFISHWLSTILFKKANFSRKTDYYTAEKIPYMGMRAHAYIIMYARTRDKGRLSIA